MAVDIAAYYTLVANNEVIPREEVITLLKELTHFKVAVAYRASCQAATLESLPKSTGKSSRGRHVVICEAAVQLIDGDSSCIRYQEDGTAAKARCKKVIENHK